MREVWVSIPGPVKLAQCRHRCDVFSELCGHRRSQDFQLGGLKFKQSYPTAGTNPENFSGGNADLI